MDGAKQLAASRTSPDDQADEGEQFSKLNSSGDKLIRTHADEDRMTELAGRGELHAAHLDHLAD
jgi:hypothetical protein